MRREEVVNLGGAGGQRRSSSAGPGWTCLSNAVSREVFSAAASASASGSAASMLQRRVSLVLAFVAGSTRAPYLAVGDDVVERAIHSVCRGGWQQLELKAAKRIGRWCREAAGMERTERRDTHDSCKPPRIVRAPVALSRSKSHYLATLTRCAVTHVPLYLPRPARPDRSRLC